MFSRLTDLYTNSVKTVDQTINHATASLNQAILRAVSEIFPRAAQNYYRPYWTEELHEREDEVSRTRETVQDNPTAENNFAHKPPSAKYRKAYIQVSRTRIGSSREP